MNALGIDIGTTNLNLSLVDLETGAIVERRSAPNERVVSADESAYLQDPAGILESVRAMLDSLEAPIGSICVTGQVHGILYVDADGRPLSPLRTWLDRSGGVEIDGATAHRRLADRSGKTMPVGYGLLTHYANRLLGRVPEGAARILGINEFVTGSLVGAVLESTDATNLAPFGAFDPIAGTHDPALLGEILPPGSPSFLSLAAPFSLAGETAAGVPVAHSAGDNQAGFFGLIPNPERTALVSVGTSGQISVFSQNEAGHPSLELRPYFGLGYLHVGATLCAGKAYEVLARLVEGILRDFGADPEPDDAYGLLAAAAARCGAPSPLRVDPAFNGTRADPDRRGSIGGIGLDTLTLGNLARGTLEGIAGELAGFKDAAPFLFERLESVVVSGGLARRNALFPEALSSSFGLPVRVAPVDGAAAFGAALIGAIAAGILPLNAASEIVAAL